MMTMGFLAPVEDREAAFGGIPFRLCCRIVCSLRDTPAFGDEKAVRMLSVLASSVEAKGGPSAGEVLERMIPPLFALRVSALLHMSAKESRRMEEARRSPGVVQRVRAGDMEVAEAWEGMGCDGALRGLVKLTAGRNLEGVLAAGQDACMGSVSASALGGGRIFGMLESLGAKASPAMLLTACSKGLGKMVCRIVGSGVSPNSARLAAKSNPMLVALLNRQPEAARALMASGFDAAKNPALGRCKELETMLSGMTEIQLTTRVMQQTRDVIIEVMGLWMESKVLRPGSKAPSRKRSL